VRERFPEAAGQNDLIADGVKKARAVRPIASREVIAGLECFLLCCAL